MCVGGLMGDRTVTVLGYNPIIPALENQTKNSTTFPEAKLEFSTCQTLNMPTMAAFAEHTQRIMPFVCYLYHPNITVHITPISPNTPGYRHRITLYWVDSASDLNNPKFSREQRVTCKDKDI